MFFKKKYSRLCSAPVLTLFKDKLFYTLLHNNDLWNLLPAHPKVNNSKRDMLPSRRIMNKRKDVIKDYWDIINEKYPARFANETARFMGGTVSLGSARETQLISDDSTELITSPLNERNRNWHEELFSVVVEAVEITAIQRGAGRWDG
jgi:hypothetical protein